jgi:hypothetical protein
MSHLKSTVLAATFGLAVAGFSGQLVSANAEPVNKPAANVYANNAGSGGQASMSSVQAEQDKDVSGSRIVPDGSTGWDIRARTGFYGYR